jgi:glycosyltransferase involved in cell wall biosynthesis
VLIFGEQALGHRVFLQNLRTQLQVYRDLDITWCDITYDRSSRLGRIPRMTRHYALWSSLQAARGLLWSRPRPDVLLFHTQTPAQLALPLMGVIPTIISLDSTQRGFASMAAAYDAIAPGRSLVDRVVHQVNRAVFRAAQALLPWSQWVARSLVDEYHVSPGAVVVNPPGVDVSRWPDRPQRDQGGPVRVLFVGGDFERKGGHLLLDALRRIDAPWELHVVTEEAVPAGDGVHVHGAIPNDSPRYAELFTRCDVFALPTFADLYSIAAIEAMASGLPVICGDVGGIAEIVAEGETGFLIRPGDEQTLHARLSALLTDSELRHRLGRAGRVRAQQRFDGRARAGTIYEVIRAVHGAGMPLLHQRPQVQLASARMSGPEGGVGPSL